MQKKQRKRFSKIEKIMEEKMKYSKIISFLFLFCCFILNTGCFKNNGNSAEILKLKQEAESGDSQAQYST